jgi:cation diffusion facilitator CzcD-associated flavoprotein CzcO
MASGNGSKPSTPAVAIVGAGFGGIGLGILLRRAGIESFTIFERADRVGGVWRDNTYPGLTCDVPSHLYSFSFEPKHDWSRRFPHRREILDYLEHCSRKYGIDDHIRFGAEVAAADFDEQRGRWRIRLGDGEEVEADVLVSATGQLSRPAHPEIPGLERFEGPCFHSARWDHDCDLDGKRVAVVGTGASAIQLVPEVAPAVAKLDLYQRSPPWVIAKPDRPYRAWQRRLFARAPWLQRLSRALVYWRFEALSLAFVRAPWLARPAERAYERKLRREISDPELRRRLLPDYPLGCKRVLISNDWLPTLERPNVSVVTEPISEVTADGVITADGVDRPADAIVLATGFKSTDFLSPMQIRGRGGRELNDAWRDGAEAYLGLAVNGFPNMFILYGPNTNLGAGSIISMLESQAGYVLEAVKRLARGDLRWMEVRDDAQSAFNAEIQSRLAGTVWNAGCHNWYRTESGRVVNNWPGGTAGYKLKTRRPRLADYTLVRA